MKTEGEYRFTNGTAIDEQLDRNRVKSVLQHEFVHNKLYTETTFGQIILMLEKNSWLDEKSKVCMETLFEYTNRMQERTAVNIEVIKEFLDNGMEAYNEAIESLKTRNRSYYNYFRKLCCINGKIKTEEDASVLSDVLMGIARIAMNVKPELIPIDTFKDAKTLKKYLGDPQNSAMVSPNKRFDIMVNCFFRNNNNNNDIESVFAGSINLEKIYDYDYIHQEAFKKVAKVYEDRLAGERLIERIKTIGVISFDFKGANYLAVKPAMINEKKEIYLKEVKTIDELIRIAKANDSSELFVAHTMGGFEEIHVISVYGKENNQKIMYNLYILNQDEFFKILSKAEFNFVFYKTKLINKEGKVIRKMVKKLPIYIFEDSPMLSDLSFIDNYFINGEFGFIEMKSRTIFVICKRSVFFFTDIVSEAKEVLINYFNNKNIYQTNNINKMCNVMELYRIDEKCNEYEVNNIADAKWAK